MNARILVIEDNPANLELMTYLLRAFKYETLAATDGEEGLASAQRERPAAVVCDIQLPKMDGFEVVRRLKADAATRPIPVIAVTAFAMVGDRDRVLAGGFDGYIGKPIVPETFVSQIERFLATTAAAAPAVSPAASTPAEPVRAAHSGARVLVVDNTLANRELYASLLGAVGYSVVIAASVKEAFASAQALAPDLILSDMNMPGEGGLDLLARVKGDPKLRNVPFMIVSASSRDEQKARAARARGADLVLLQSNEPQTLLAEVEKLLAKAEK